MSSGVSMRWTAAMEIARRVKTSLEPYCDRVEIAGSLRRGKPVVKDIEIVAIPRPRDLIGFTRAVEGLGRRLKGQPGGKYMQRALPEGPVLDLFLCTPETWACVFLIRTGSADFSRSLVTYATRVGRRFRDGRLWHRWDGGGAVEGEWGSAISLAEEADVFRELGLKWVEPAAREGVLYQAEMVR